MTSRDEPAELEVHAGEEPLPFDIRDSSLRPVKSGLTGEAVSLAAGTYVVSVQLPGGDLLMDTLQLTPGEKSTKWFDLEPTALEPRPRKALASFEERPTLTLGLRALMFEAAIGVAGSGVAAAEVEPEVLEGLRVTTPELPERLWMMTTHRMQGLQESWPEPGTRIGDVAKRGSTLHIVIDLHAPGLSFVQFAAPRQVPLNVALPAASWAGATTCMVTIEARANTLYAGAFPATPKVNLAAQYLAAGDVREGATLLSEPDMEALLHGKMADPVGAAVGGYLLLRAGALRRMHDWAQNLAAYFPWLPDGLVIAGEMAARDGDHDRALHHFLAVEEAGLPIFSDGFSFLVSRLRQYAAAESPPKAADPAASGRLLDRLMEWVPFVDYSAPTLTFRSADIARPLESQHPLAVKPNPVLEIEESGGSLEARRPWELITEQH